MPALRKLPPAPVSPSGTVATYDTTVPGGYAWETATAAPPFGSSPVIRTTALGTATVTTYDTKIIIEKAGFLLGMRMSGGVVPGGQSLLANLLYNGGAQIWPSLTGPALGPGGGGVGAFLAVPGGSFAVLAGDYLLVQNEQVGSGPAGSDINYDIFTS